MRPIDADALKAKLREGLEHYQYRPDDFAIGKVSGLVDAMEEVDRAPTIDAIPVEWLEDKELDYRATGNKMFSDAFTIVIDEWQKEQGAR